jgi:mutator protein MutT
LGKGEPKFQGSSILSDPKEESMTRIYPAAPVCAVGAVVFQDDSVLLVQRAQPPSQGLWSIPGGVVRLGETLESAVIREVEEEVRIEVRPVQIGKVLDRIYRDPQGRVSYHYVIIDFLCDAISGVPFPGSDATSARYFEIRELDSLRMTEGTAEVIRELHAQRRQ